MRHPHDFYETAPWQTKALLAHQPVCGPILECCSGDDSIANVLRKAGHDVFTNDIDPKWKADFNLDARDPALYDKLSSGFAWVITNPPYEMPLCRDIVATAVRYAKIGVAMMLRISFKEPTAKVNPRGPWLEANPPSRSLTLPRYSFTRNGKSDSATTEWLIWIKDKTYNVGPPILCIYQADERFK